MPYPLSPYFILKYHLPDPYRSFVSDKIFLVVFPSFALPVISKITPIKHEINRVNAQNPILSGGREIAFTGTTTTPLGQQRFSRDNDSPVTDFTEKGEL